MLMLHVDYGGCFVSTLELWSDYESVDEWLLSSLMAHTYYIAQNLMISTLIVMKLWNGCIHWCTEMLRVIKTLKALYM